MASSAIEGCLEVVEALFYYNWCHLMGSTIHAVYTYPSMLSFLLQDVKVLVIMKVVLSKSRFHIPCEVKLWWTFWVPNVLLVATRFSSAGSPFAVILCKWYLWNVVEFENSQKMSHTHLGLDGFSWGPLSIIYKCELLFQSTSYFARFHSYT